MGTMIKSFIKDCTVVKFILGIIKRLLFTVSIPLWFILLIVTIPLSFVIWILTGIPPERIMEYVGETLPEIAERLLSEEK